MKAEQYVALPRTAEAVRWDGDWHSLPADWRSSGVLKMHHGDLICTTLRFQAKVFPGDFLVRGVNHEIAPMDPATFLYSFDRPDHVAEAAQEAAAS